MEIVVETASCERDVRSERDLLPEDVSRVRVFAIRRLVTAAVELAAHEDWDGEGASPIGGSVVEHAMHVAGWIEARGLPTPVVEPEPEGWISFTWEPEPGRIAAIDVKPDGTMLFTCYDGRIGKNEYGHLDGPIPPESLANGIRDLHGE